MHHDLSRHLLSPSAIARFWPKVNKGGDADCWEWTACRQPTGYGRFSISPSCREYAHRVAFMAAHDRDIPAGMVVMHSCDNPPCCNPSHLRLGTPSENSRDRDLKGRGGNGNRLITRTNGVRFLDEHPDEVVALYEQGCTFSEIERRLDVGRGNIHRWLKRRGALTRAKCVFPKQE